MPEEKILLGEEESLTEFVETLGTDEYELVETLDADERELEANLEHAEKFATVGLTITFVLSLVISLVVFFGIVARKSELKSKFTRWLKEFLNFRKMWIVGILKYVYVFIATFLTIGGVVLMFYNDGNIEPWVTILAGLAIILVGNLMLRLSFEMTMVVLGLWENTRDMRNALVGGKVVAGKAEKSEKAKKEEE